MLYRHAARASWTDEISPLAEVGDTGCRRTADRPSSDAAAPKPERRACTRMPSAGGHARAARHRRYLATHPACAFHALRWSVATTLPWRAGCSSSSIWAVSASSSGTLGSAAFVEEQRSRPARLLVVL